MNKLMVIAFLTLSTIAFADQKVKVVKNQEVIPGLAKQVICSKPVVGTAEQQKSVLDLKKQYGCKP